jgi:hypothetical protein
MDVFRLLVRMAWWVRRPPSRRQLITVAVVLALAAVLYAIEVTVGWPDWLSVEPTRDLHPRVLPLQ